MASKSYNEVSFSFMLLLLLLLITISSSGARPQPRPRKPSAFDFVKDLRGCHKGQNKTGLHRLKTYLKRFGYLDYHHTKYESHANDDEFDDLLESAVRTYQLNHRLNPTGTLDANTVAQMVKPRCGVPDNVNNDDGVVAEYSFFPGNPKWPDSKRHLTYAFESNTPTPAIQAVAQAFSKWQSATHFTFSQVQSLEEADLTIGFQRGRHWDPAPFDGPGGTIAHAFRPTIGIFHYDDDDSFTVDSNPNAFHLETIALHEIGHLLGLGHSRDRNAVMFDSINYGEVKPLHQDDIQGIRALYNV